MLHAVVCYRDTITLGFYGASQKKFTEYLFFLKVNYTFPNARFPPKHPASSSNQMAVFRNLSLFYSKVISDFLKFSMGKWQPTGSSNTWV